MIENLHILFTSIEELFETDKFNGPEERFFALIEKSASKRPVSATHPSTLIGILSPPPSSLHSAFSTCVLDKTERNKVTESKYLEETLSCLALISLYFFFCQEHSLHVLVSFKAQTVHPAQEGWLTNLHNLMEKYFRYQCMIYHVDNGLLGTQE